MATPANNNFANAIGLGGDSGTIFGTNIEATAEAGEPASKGKTVWYAFTPATDGFIRQKTFFFSTLFHGAIGALANPLRSNLQVFTGTSLADLSEVTYIQGSWKKNFAGWEFGGYVFFTALLGSTYYIRVDGVPNSKDSTISEGNFQLSYGLHFPVRLGGCSDCPPQSLDPYLKCLGTVTLTDVLNPYNIPFGENFPRGRYMGGYCAGAVNFEKTSLKPWGVYLDNGLGNGPHFNFIYKKNGAQQIIALGNLPGAPSTLRYASAAEAEAAFRCTSSSFSHEGGPILLQYWDSPYSDNDNGSYSKPTFALYRLEPKFVASSACAQWVVKGTSASCVFTIKNLNLSDWDKITVTLQSSGGISSPSAPVTSWSIPAGGTANVNFTFNAATPNVTATLVFSSSEFVDTKITFYLGPIFKLFGLQTQSSSLCSGRKRWSYSLGVTNIGYWRMVPILTFTTDNGVQLINGSCALSSSLDVSAIFLIACNGGVQSVFFDIAAPTATKTTNLGVELKESGASFGKFNFPITVSA